MALIDPLPPDGDTQFRDLFDQFYKASGYVPNGMLTLQRRPEILKCVSDLHRVVMAQYPGSRVTPELKILLAHLASRASGCRYCQAHTAYGAERRGAEADRITEIWEFRTSPLFDDAERAALELAVCAGVTPNAVTPEIQQEAQKYWTDDELVEIVAAIAVMGFANRWNDTVTTQLEDAPRAYASERLASLGWNAGRH